MDALAIDPKTTALVVIDLQAGIVAMTFGPRSSSEVVANANRLTSAFRIAGAPVVLVRVGNMQDNGDLLKPTIDNQPPVSTRPESFMTIVPELGPMAGDIVVTKRQWGAFYGTELDLQLRRRGIKTIVLLGLSTNVGVESTARDAFERGYDQIFVEDAMSSPSAEAHAITLKVNFPRMGRIRSTEQVLGAITR